MKQRLKRPEAAPKRSKGVIALYIILRLIVIAVLISNLVQKEYEAAFTCALTLIMFMLPALLEWKLNVDMPNTLEVIALLFIFAHEILGELGSYYITKPYSIKNILARIKAVLRRTAPAANSGQMEADKSPFTNYPNYTNHPPSAPAPDLLEYQGLRISLISKVCSVGGREVRMPRKEFEILALLMSRPGRVFTRQEILDAVWPREVVVLDRVVDVNITRLRTKLGPYGHLIVTKTGYGYVFTD